MENTGTLPVLLAAFYPTAPHWGTLPALSLPARGWLRWPQQWVRGASWAQHGHCAAPKRHIQAGSTVVEPGKMLTKALGASSAVGFQLLLCRVVGSPQKTELTTTPRVLLLQRWGVPSAPVPAPPLTLHAELQLLGVGDHCARQLLWRLLAQPVVTTLLLGLAPQVGAPVHAGDVEDGNALQGRVAQV